METPILELKEIGVIAKDGVIVRNINLSVPKGELIALIGESGSGKSTVLRVIAGWEKPSIGHVLMTLGDKQVDITDVPINERDIHLMPPNYELFRNMNAIKNISYGLKCQELTVGEVNEQVLTLIKELELNGYEYRYLPELSSEQQQRIAFARTIIGKPSILLLDEPFSALNDRLCAIMQNIIKRYQEQYGMTVIYTTHNMKTARHFADRIIEMREGVMV